MTRFLLLVLSIVLICGAAVGCQTQNSNEDMSSTNLSTDSTSALTQDTEESTSETTGLAGTETTEDVDITEDETTAPPEMMDKEDSPYYGKIAVAYGDIYGFTIVDGNCTGFDASDPEFCKNYMVDGVHPNQDAHLLYGEAVAKVLLTKK